MLIADERQGCEVHPAAEQSTITTADGAKQATVDKVCGYLENKHPYLRYDIALAAGWPIATGIIEGACRHLVKDRLTSPGPAGVWKVPKPSSSSAP